MQVRAILLTLAAGAFAPPQAGAQETLAQVEQQIVAAWEKVQTVSGDFQLEVKLNLNGMVLPGRGSGRIEHKRGAVQNLARADVTGALTVPLGDTTADLPQNISVIFDGSKVHMLMRVLRAQFAMSEDASAEKDKDRPPAVLLFKALHDAGRVQLLRDAVVDGAPVNTIRADLHKPLDENVLPATAMVFHFDKGNRMLRRVEAFDANGAAIGALVIRRIRLNENIAQERFTFSPPPDAQVIDFSQAGKTLVPGT